jgi:hypothetical protein
MKIQPIYHDTEGRRDFEGFAELISRVDQEENPDLETWMVLFPGDREPVRRRVDTRADKYTLSIVAKNGEVVAGYSFDATLKTILDILPAVSELVDSANDRYKLEKRDEDY